MKTLNVFFGPLATASVMVLLMLTAADARAQGGPINTATTSTSRGETHSAGRVDLPDVQVYQTRLLSYLYSNTTGTGTFLFDASFNATIGDPAVQAAAEQARQILSNAGASDITGPVLISSSTSRSPSVKIGEVFTHAETTVSTQSTFGPATILIGPDQSQTFFVPPGSVNFNTHTHTQSFFSDLYQAIVTQVDTYQLTGALLGVAVNNAQGQPGGGGGGGGSSTSPQFVVLDLGAILSLEQSFLPFSLSQQAILQSATNTALRDVNGRLFQLRAGTDEQDTEAGDAAPAPRSTSGGGGKALAKDAPHAIAPEDNYHRLELFASGDFGSANLNSIATSSGFQSETYAGTVGLEWRLNRALTLGIAASYLENDTDLAADLGHTDLSGGAVAAYASYLRRHFYLDGLYSFGGYEHDLRRNTLTGRTARAEPDSTVHSAELNLGYNIPLARGLTTGPMLSARFSHGDIDGYTETGGGAANVEAAAQQYDSLISSVGWQASYRRPTRFGSVTLQLRAGWEHQFLDDGDDASGQLVDSPMLLVGGGGAPRRIGSFALSQSHEGVEEDALVAGGGLLFSFGNRASLLLDYEGRLLRDDLTEHFASVRASVKF